MIILAVLLLFGFDEFYCERNGRSDRLTRLSPLMAAEYTDID